MGRGALPAAGAGHAGRPVLHRDPVRAAGPARRPETGAHRDGNARAPARPALPRPGPGTGTAGLRTGPAPGRNVALGRTGHLVPLARHLLADGLAVIVADRPVRVLPAVDLVVADRGPARACGLVAFGRLRSAHAPAGPVAASGRAAFRTAADRPGSESGHHRSEEHTSELQ